MAEKKVDNVIINVGFSEEQELKELKSGERLSVLMGKLAKGVKDLVTHLADNVKHVTAAERTTWNGKAAGNHTHNAATSSANGFMSVADKTKLEKNTEDIAILNGTGEGSVKKTVDDETANFLPLSGGTITVPDVKSAIRNNNGKVFRIRQSSTVEFDSGIYFDGNEILHMNSILESGNVKLKTAYHYASSDFSYFGEELVPNTSVSASNLINGVAMYKQFGDDRSFKIYATKRGSTADTLIGTEAHPWTHIYAENIHCTNPPWASAASINDIELAMCDLYESMNKEDT